MNSKLSVTNLKLVLHPSGLRKAHGVAIRDDYMVSTRHTLTRAKVFLRLFKPRDYSFYYTTHCWNLSDTMCDCVTHVD